MGVPKEIREVTRPKNTIVVDNGIDGPKRYAVRERAGTKYVPHGNPRPKNGKVIGYIVNSQYIPRRPDVSQCTPDMLSYGGAAFVKSVSDDLLSSLLEVYSTRDAHMIMTIATLRVLHPSVANGRLAADYNRSFVSVFYPGISLSGNTVSKFMHDLGQDGNKRRMFYKSRVEAVAKEHHIAIDSMLKQDTSIVNDLSAYSRKSRVKGCKDISVIYAYDIETLEPICGQVVLGNAPDSSAYRSFIVDNDIQKGIILCDKAFPPSMIKAELEERPDLHFLTPIKRNDKRIANNDMLAFENILQGVEDHVLYKKEAIRGGRYLYAFKSARIAASQESAYIAQRARRNSFNSKEYAAKQPLFGVIVFLSDQDLDPITVWRCYDQRWLLELVFDRYKNDECLDKTNVQGDFSVLGSEFINFIATTITCRLIQKAEKAGLLDELSYADLMEDLRSAWRMVDAPDVLPDRDDSYWVHTLKSVHEELERLGLSTPIPKPKAAKRNATKSKANTQTTTSKAAASSKSATPKAAKSVMK